VETQEPQQRIRPTPKKIQVRKVNIKNAPKPVHPLTHILGVLNNLPEDEFYTHVDLLTLIGDAAISVLRPTNPALRGYSYKQRLVTGDCLWWGSRAGIEQLKRKEEQ